MNKKQIEICYWCGKIKTGAGEWVEPTFEISTEIYNKIMSMCPDCLAEMNAENA